jgi:hypothetical protein
MSSGKIGKRMLRKPLEGEKEGNIRDEEIENGGEGIEGRETENVCGDQSAEQNSNAVVEIIEGTEIKGILMTERMK